MNETGREFLKFIIIGVVNTINYYAVYLLLHLVFDVYYLAAHITGFMVSLVGSFFLNTYFTFKVKPTWGKFLKFPITQLFNFSVTSLFVFVFTELFHVDSKITPLLAVFITVPMTFVITGKILKRRECNR
ncbi:GtrA family protein [Virgibacillus pantothenticus]|uniref:Polysaccharide biosynthesis protein n=1 Tax=Virgibacillus pantothenticus TaxID=1473 RepID=A0A0L0QJK9_VIRPA|nr:MULTISPECIES: GtrA family protein [Virgibacillus]API93036.1 polysaccharide biosynthesis protein [Virgibacillus sp. 6R]KNE18742.1 polysaccharide biosynthesis protein [Virgibacillus pantothenticus]MBS7429286.1 GtrA family protein [Virgibacillus sp. 19R1-5]MBU8567099.1 GtrA family protein [Virgibacillus pantothenticus]MBU8600869.1 GtrA family protein [Virgibacillus pantothenticus]